MNKLQILIFCLFLCIASSISADVIYLNEGEEILGKLHSITDGKVTIVDLQETSRTIDSAEIAHILISKIRKGDEITEIASITDPVAAGILQNLPDPAQFNEANYVTLYRLYDYEYVSETEIIQRVREIVQILKEPGLNQANQSVYYYTDREELDLEYAHTYSASGKVYHITDDAVSDESMRSSTPEYAKLKRLKMALKKVDIGSIIDYSYVKRLKGIGELSPFVIHNTFGEREPILHEELSVVFPEQLKLNKVLMQWPAENAPRFIEKTDNGKTSWKWIYANPKGFIPEQNMLPTARVFPRCVIYQPYDWNKISTELNLAYQSARPDAALLEELLTRANLNEANSSYAKVTRIYETINKDIRDLGMSAISMGSHAPVSANVTIAKKYGNTQAILALMHFAFEKVGIKSYPGFVTGRRENVTAKDHPTLGLANFAVLKVVIDGKTFYTDLGSVYQPFSTYSTNYQGAMAAFLDAENNNFCFEELPRQTLSWNRFDHSVFVKILLDGSMEVKESLLFRGPYEAGIRELKSIKEKEKQNYAEKRVKRVHPKAVLTSFGLSDLNDLNGPAVMTLDYKIPEAAQLASDKIMTFTNFWVNYQSSSASLASRTFPMQYWASEENQQTIVFELPENFNWVNWGRQYQHTSPDIIFFSNINQNGDRLIYADRFTIYNDEFLTDADYQNYRQCILTMSELANQWIIIEKKEPEAPAVASEPVTIPASGTVESQQPQTPPSESEVKTEPADSSQN
ncbi:MAG: DUF3857 domain-containing protein [Candidatus Riflebacteria bacterium]|nr:DUF3857 domain-containing protein [Candidatus Riflebacteria bacterium]